MQSYSCDLNSDDNCKMSDIQSKSIAIQICFDSNNNSDSKSRPHRVSQLYFGLNFAGHRLIIFKNLAICTSPSMLIICMIWTKFIWMLEILESLSILLSAQKLFRKYIECSSWTPLFVADADAYVIETRFKIQNKYKWRKKAYTFASRNF